jgi:hypothetical protein
MNRKVPISAIGSVRPVMTVLRQLLRNRKTMQHRQHRAFDQRALHVGHRLTRMRASCRG